MLVWQCLCEQLADFANTFAARRQCLTLPITPPIVEMQRLVEETKWVAKTKGEEYTTGWLPGRAAAACAERSGTAAPLVHHADCSQLA